MLPSVGVPVFSLLDTSKWYVIANFREAEVRHMAPGSEAIVYLSSAPNQRFRGKVQGIGWAVKPEGEIDLPPAGVPYVKRELNWVRVAQRFPVRIEVENPDPRSFPDGRVRGCDHQRSAAEIIYERDVPRSAPDRFRLDWLAQTRAGADERAQIRTAIIVAGAVLCVIISMALQVPELATSAYMVFFVSKETKLLTTITGVGGVIRSDHRHWRHSPALQIHLWSSGTAHSRNGNRALSWNVVVPHFVLGPLGFLLGFVIAVSQSVGEEIPSPELLVRGLLWLWVALVYAIALTVVLNLLFLPDTPKAAAPPKPKPSRTGVVYLCRTRSRIPRTCISPSKSLSPRCSATSFMRRSIGRESTRRSLPARSSRSRALRQRSTKELCESSVA
jgi:hypothetical protein